MKRKVSVFWHYASIPLAIITVSLTWMLYYLLNGLLYEAKVILLMGIILSNTIFIQNMLLTFSVGRKVDQKKQILAALLLITIISFASLL